ncbi:hypothetical protein [Pseudomonas poae]|uniref:Lipoprotein n=1 Tax=Pseudomonas poae TaxID=200451 RepID=A0A2S9EYU9_9PSED|nr:hypothetical protein [Pseudomonas poae]PRA30799.1 hypothetical protein CQZ97_09755 [Pseudomonas poae]PRC22351.1 hypothetical protein CQZ99_02035 [Pseudomonas poae]
MKHLAVIITLGLLSGCSFKPVKSEPAFGEVLKQPPLADSILRDGDQLSYQVHVTPSKGSSVPDIAQVRVSCATPEASLLFLESPGTLAANGQPTRFTVMRTLTPAVVDNLKQNASFIDACAHTPRPDWRVVSGTATQRQLLLDRASLKTVGDSVQVWAAVDEPFILTNKLKKMPYAQTRLHWQVSCGRQTYRTLATFGLNENNVVTFGNLETSPQDAAFGSADADTQALLKAVCSPTVAQLPAATPRTKTEETLTPPPLSTDVQQAISALGLPKASKTPGHLSLKRDLGYGPAPMDLYIQPNTEPDQLRIRNVTQYSTYTTTSWRGLFNLTFQSQYKMDGIMVSSASHLQQLSFIGDWQQMAVGATLGYSTVEMNRTTTQDDRALIRNARCVVKRELPASKINSALSGTAKELNCTTTGEKYSAISTVFYLQDYGYFFTSQDDSGTLKVRNSLVKAE